MKMTFRSWFFVGALGCAAAATNLLTKPVLAEPEWETEQAFAPEDEQAADSGMLTEESLGQLIAAAGLTATKEDKRYDFTVEGTYGEQTWQHSMSAVLSQDGQTLWLMAWLDELPKTAPEVPRSALLRLLAENDKLGAGKFFAFVPANRRFVLERVIGNREIPPEQFRAVLDDLAQSVADTHSTWSVAGWNKPAGESENADPAGQGGQPAAQNPAGRTVPSAVNDSKYQDVRRN